MGGHGGLNILPQKRWNVYNFDNREKVKKDEEAAAKEEQLQREQSRRRDTELRLEQLRTARGLAPTVTLPSSSAPVVAPAAAAAPAPVTKPVASSNSKHINLFDGIKIFDLIDGPGKRKADEEAEGRKKKMLKLMREKVPEQRVVTEEDEKYRLGYGVVGKGAKLPWYVANPSSNGPKKGGSDGDIDNHRSGKDAKKSGGKKTIEELREERLSRESREKARTQALILDKNHKDVDMPKDRYFSRRSM